MQLKQNTVIDLIRNILSCEFLLILYFWGSVILRPYLQSSSNSSSVLLVFTIIILALSLLDLRHSTTIYKNIFWIICLLFAVMFFDLLLRANQFTGDIFQNFILCAIIPVWLVSRVRDWDLVARFFVVFSVLVFLRYCSDPFLGYVVFKQDMTFGFDCALPAAIGIYVGAKAYKNKILYVLFWIAVAEIAIFANRSSLISIIVLLLIYNFGVNKKALSIKVFIVAALACIVLMNFQIIIIWFMNAISRLGFQSYAISSYIEALNAGSVEVLFHGRFLIWENAFSMFMQSPIVGKGTGCFINAYNTYTHNIFLDVLVQYGILGAVFFVGLLINNLKNIFYHESGILIPGMIFLCIWFPKLLVSQYMFDDKAIWIFVAIGLISSYGRKMIEVDCDGR